MAVLLLVVMSVAPCGYIEIGTLLLSYIWYYTFRYRTTSGFIVDEGDYRFSSAIYV